MLVFFAALIIMVAMCAAMIGFLVWAFHQWRTAQKYRYLIRLHNAMPPAQAYTKGGGQQWTIVYKVKGKKKTMEVSGTSEGEILKNFVKTHGVSYADIVSCEKS